MKMTSMAVAVAGACLASAAVANHAPTHKVAAVSAKDKAMAAVVQGNSVWPMHTVSVLGGKVQLGGMANIDGYWSSDVNYTSVPMFNQASSNALGAGGNASAIYVHNANLFIGSKMGIAEMHMNIGFFDGRTVTNTGTGAFGGQANLTLDEGYVTLSDFSKMPVYAKVGYFYNQFGNYNPYQMVPDLTNLFTQVKGTGVELGTVLPNGFYGNITGFSASSDAFSTTNQSRVGDFSAKAGYAAKSGDVDWGVDVSYLNHIQDLTYVGSNDFLVNYQLGAATTPVSFSKKSSLWAGYGHAAVRNFDFGLKFVRASDDMTVNGNNLDHPWALAGNAGYSFATAGHASRVGLGYQMTRKSEWLYVPKTRYLASYGIAVNQYMNVQLAYYYDKNYTTTGITAADHNNLLAARISVAF
jgi:hypothetical protein